MILALRFKVQDMNVSDNHILYGYPSILAFHGFLKNLELKINKTSGSDIKINRFLPFIQDIQYREGLSRKGADITADTLFDMPRAHVSGTLLFKVEGDIKADNFFNITEKLLYKMRIGGGKIHDFNIFIPKKRIYGFYPKIKNKVGENVDILKTIIQNSIYGQKGVKSILRIGELILTTLDHKSNFGHNVNVSAAIFAEVEHLKYKGRQFSEEFFNKNSMYLTQYNRSVILKQGE